MGILKHIKNALKKDLSKDNSVFTNFTQTGTNGKTYNINYYNLEVIISTGYRLKSKEGIALRRWLNNILKSYILKGHIL